MSVCEFVIGLRLFSHRSEFRNAVRLWEHYNDVAITDTDTVKKLPRYTGLFSRLATAPKRDTQLTHGDSSRRYALSKLRSMQSAASWFISRSISAFY